MSAVKPVDESVKPILPRITSPRAAGDYLLGKAQRGFGVLCLNGKGDLLADEPLPASMQAVGLVASSKVFQVAMRHGAFAVLFYHSTDGMPDPTDEDRALSSRLRKVGENIGLHFADYLILAADRSHSLRVSQGWEREG